MEPVALKVESTRRLAQRAPLVTAVVCIAFGIVAGRYLDMPTKFWTWTCGVMLLIAGVSFFARRLHLITSLAIGMVILSAGAIHGRLAYYHVADDDIVTYTAHKSILATLRGQVVTSPVRVSDTTSIGYRRPDRTRFILNADQIATDDGHVKVSGLVQVTIKEPADDIAAGQTLELVGTIGRFSSPANPGQFDNAAAARANGTLVWMRVEAPDGATVMAQAKMPAKSKAYWNLRASVRQHLNTLGSDADGRLLNAMIIGERHPALSKLNQAMVDAGVAHFLSISGLHLGVFLGFIYLLSRLAQLTPRRSAVLVLVVLGLYMMLAEPRAALLRSAMMAVAVCASIIFRRRYGALNALAAAAIVLLAIDPMQLFLPGFQLSFAIVAGLIVLYWPVRSMLFGRWLKRRGLVVFRSDQSFRRWSQYTLANWLINGLTVSLVAYLTATPLVAYHFGLFSPYAVVLNVLLFPLVAAVLIPGYLSMALLWPLPGLAWSIGRVSAAAADLLGRVIELISDLPGLSEGLQPLSIGWLVLAYAAILAVVYYRHIPFGKLTAAAVVLGLCGWTVITQLPARRETHQLHLLAVGSGQCALLTSPAGQSYMLDAGTISGYDPATKVIKPFLLNKRIASPSAAFISHANSDHFNGIATMLANGDLRDIYLNHYFANGPQGPSWAESAPAELLQQISEYGAKTSNLRAGDILRLDEQTTVTVLWPPARYIADLSANDSSLVLMIECSGGRILMTGDIGQLPQSELLAGRTRLKADVLILPHHGAWTASLPQFVEAVDPEVVLVSSSRRKIASAIAGDPKTEFFAKLMNNRRYFSTARDGWICASLEDSRISIETMR